MRVDSKRDIIGSLFESHSVVNEVKKDYSLEVENAVNGLGNLKWVNMGTFYRATINLKGVKDTLSHYMSEFKVEIDIYHDDSKIKVCIAFIGDKFKGSRVYGEYALVKEVKDAKSAVSFINRALKDIDKKSVSIAYEPVVMTDALRDKWKMSEIR